MANILLANIKLIIWDLDDTFWKGTLSEGGVQPIKENIELVKDLTDRGIVNAICSKNDYNPAVEELKKMGVADYFVFNSINWNPKGERISKMISDMGLRPVNVLFIDDNVVNLNEARYYSDNIMTAEPTILPELAWQIEAFPIKDKEHSRLKNYRILEQKRDSKASYSNNEEFLYSTNTHVEIKKDCLAQIDRIHELIMRTNQLNFTKKRISKEELEQLLRDMDVDAGYVHVSDKFGDYGIVGFYAIKERVCIHFLFSCRTIGQGIEQYVYSILNHPKLHVVGQVINNVQNIPPPAWINQKQESGRKATVNQYSDGLVIFKGACDLSILTSFFESNIPIKEEFTYVGEKHNEIEHHNHSTNYTSLPFLSESEKKELLDDCIFNDKGIFETSIYDDDVSLIFISSLPEANLGIYRKKNSNLKIAFAEWTYPLTDSQMWDSYVNKKVHVYLNDFKIEWLRSFSEKYEFIGRITPKEYVDNLEFLLKKISPKAKLCIMLGCEKAYEGEISTAYLQRELYHQQMNKAIHSFAKDNNRVLLIDWTDFVKSQKDFTDNINHYQRYIYYQASIAASGIIRQVLGRKIKKINIFKRTLSYIGKKYTNRINRDSKLYPIIRDVYHWLADKRR